MRTLYDYPLLLRIQQSPAKTIAQRSIPQLRAFVNGYDRLRQIANLNEITERLHKQPPLSRFLERRHRVALEDRHWSSLFTLTSESETEAFEHFFEAVSAYERTFPLAKNNVPRYELRKRADEGYYDLQLWFYDLLKDPERHLNEVSLRCIRCFIEGYYHCKREHGLAFTRFEQHLFFYCNDLSTQLDLASPFATWDRIFAWLHPGHARGVHLIDQFLTGLERNRHIKVLRPAAMVQEANYSTT